MPVPLHGQFWRTSESKLVIEIRADDVPLWRTNDCESGLSTVEPSEGHATLCQQSGPDDKYATAWRSTSPVALVPSLLSPEVLPCRFGRYDILGVLGEGEMGSVFLARDKQLDRQVAMKIPKANHTLEAAMRFEREACVMAKLRHPNVCPVYDVGELDGTHFLTMPYIEGETLAEHLVPAWPQSCRQTAKLVRKLATALAAVHEAGVIHRDVKPANIMIDTSGEPIIMDFGLAKSASCSFAVKDRMVGTPAYMPPEQVRGDVGGPTSDIYSLGVVMYEMLAGRIPFEGTLTAVLRKAVSGEPPPPPSRFNPGLDRKLEAICLRAMAKPVEDRFPSALAFANAMP